MAEKEFFAGLESLLSDHMGSNVAIKDSQAVYGGDINETFLLQTNSGPLFLKLNRNASKDMFVKEFNGLMALSNTAAIHVPKPILDGEIGNTIFLVMEYVKKGKPGNNFWQDFARGLATLHRNTQDEFGFFEDNYMGSVTQSNKQYASWHEFYASERIMPLMLKAHNQNNCSKDDIAKAEKLCAGFTEIFPEEPPALLHGDLWSGNFIANENGKPVIYDPAVYYGNREMDIAMTKLFGGFDKTFYNYYNEIYPLQKGWEKRIALCHLYPLLIHLVLFGGHYYFSAMNIINDYL